MLIPSTVQHVRMDDKFSGLEVVNGGESLVMGTVAAVLVLT